MHPAWAFARLIGLPLRVRLRVGARIVASAERSVVRASGAFDDAERELARMKGLERYDPYGPGRVVKAQAVVDRARREYQRAVAFRDDVKGSYAMLTIKRDQRRAGNG